MKIIIKIILIALLIGCLFKMPYGYYQLMRWCVCAGFIYFAFIEYEAKRIYITVVCILIAILFNPLKSIYFKKETWHSIDLTIAIALSIWIIIDFVMLSKSNYEK